MTEEQIERFVEAKTNTLDNRYMNGRITEAEYQFKMRALDRWAEQKYRAVR